MKFTIIVPANINKSQIKKAEKILKEFKGPAKYSFKRSFRDHNDNKLVNPEGYMDFINHACQQERAYHGTPEDEWMIYLMNNPEIIIWMSSQGDYESRNIYFNISASNILVNNDWVYPLVYELACLPLQLQICDTFQDFMQLTLNHEHNGCINQLCKLPGDANVKMRTADICSECGRKLTEKNVRFSYVIQSLNILNEIRQYMLLSNDWIHTLQPSAIEMRPHYNLKVPDYDQEINFHGKQIRALYYYILKDADEHLDAEGFDPNIRGIYRTSFNEKIDQIAGYYQGIVGGTAAAARESMENFLSDDFNNQILQSALSKSKNKIKQIFGLHADMYSITNYRGSGFYYIPITAYPELIKHVEDL